MYCIGFGIYYVQDDHVKVVNFDIIAIDVTQDSYAAVSGLRLLREQEFFIEIERAVFSEEQERNYIVWADCGKHFRNKLFLGYLLKELAETANIHGKFFYNLLSLNKVLYYLIILEMT